MTAPLGTNPLVDGEFDPTAATSVDLTEQANDATEAPRQKVMAGLAMRRARELAGIDRASAASEMGVGRWDLRAIESGRRGADVAVVERAIDIYGGARLDLPPRVELVHPADPYLLVIGDEQVRVDPFRDDDGEVLAAYVDAVRRQRGLESAAVVRFRSDDLVQLASVLDLSSADLAERLRRLTGLDRDPAIQAARRLILTGLAMAIAGAPAAPTGRIRAAGAGSRRLFDVGRSRTDSPEAAAVPEAVAALGGATLVDSTDGHALLDESDAVDDTELGDGAPASLFTVRERGAAVVADSSWLARDGSRPTFSTVPTVHLDAIADLVAQVDPDVADEDLTRSTFAAPCAALPPASDTGSSTSNMAE